MNEEEREGLKTLYDEVKKKHGDLSREENKLNRKKEKGTTGKELTKDPFKLQRESSQSVGH